MNTEALQKLSDELSANARALEGVTRETIIKPLARKGPKKGGDDTPKNGKGISILVCQTVDGIEMTAGGKFEAGGMVTPELALRAVHGNLDKALVGGMRAETGGA